MENSLKNTSKYFESKLIARAAKDQTSKKRVAKDLEKCKAEYAKHKNIVDDLQSKKQDIELKLNKALVECKDSRKRMDTLYRTMQFMDLSNASDAVFYNDEHADVGYIIGGKEYHLSVDSDGEMSIIPMLSHRKARKAAKQNQNQPTEELNPEGAELPNSEENAEELNSADDNVKNVAEADDEDDDLFDSNFVSDLEGLYNDLSSR